MTFLFQRLLKQQKLRSYEDEVTRSGSFVFLYSELGFSYYLDSDERVWMEDAFPKTPLTITQERDRIAALVLGARNLGDPDLLSLLPQRPTDAVTCGRCKGGRFAPPLEGVEFKIICLDCWGLGWAAR